MPGRSKPTMRSLPISVTGTALISGYLVASTSVYLTPLLSSQSMSA